VLVGIGLGTAAYVGVYIFAHDGMAHDRFWVPMFARPSALFGFTMATRFD
jgi:hypothetical protein